jgi:hypothetical protein
LFSIQVKKSIENESIKRDGDDDSDSSSSSEEVGTIRTKAPSTPTPTASPTQQAAPTSTEELTTPEPTEAPNTSESEEVSTTPETTEAPPTPQPTEMDTSQKPSTKSGEPRKPSEPSTIDCDNDHKVSVQDDYNLSGVLVVKSCHASRFIRKPSRCSNVGDKFSSLLNVRLGKVGIKDQFNVKIVKTLGNQSQTEFYYQVPCQKAQQQQVISSLKDTCKDKDFQDTVTEQNQPDADDSSSESDEDIKKIGQNKLTDLLKKVQTNLALPSPGFRQSAKSQRK